MCDKPNNRTIGGIEESAKRAEAERSGYGGGGAEQPPSAAEYRQSDSRYADRQPDWRYADKTEAPSQRFRLHVAANNLRDQADALETLANALPARLSVAQERALGLVLNGLNYR